MTFFAHQRNGETKDSTVPVIPIITITVSQQRSRWTKDPKKSILKLQNPGFSSHFVTIFLPLRAKVFQKPNVPMLSAILGKLACGVEKGINWRRKSNKHHS